MGDVCGVGADTLLTVAGWTVRFVRVGAEQEVNISEVVRNKILATEITRCVPRCYCDRILLAVIAFPRCVRMPVKSYYHWRDRPRQHSLLC